MSCEACVRAVWNDEGEIVGCREEYCLFRELMGEEAKHISLDV